MIDPKHVGLELAPHTVEVERGRLKFFAKATGQTDPVYTDVNAAQAAGYADLPAPPTFGIAMEMEVENPFEIFDILEVDLGKLLHGNQQFAYHKPIVAGDSLTFFPRIEDIFAKSGGALEFIVRKTRVENQRNEHVADLIATLVVRNG